MQQSIKNNKNNKKHKNDDNKNKDANFFLDFEGNPFFPWNFRGTVYTCHKDLFLYIPYLRGLLRQQSLCGTDLSARDDNGNFVIDENGVIVFLYRVLKVYSC